MHLQFWRFLADDETRVHGNHQQFQHYCSRQPSTTAAFVWTFTLVCFLYLFLSLVSYRACYALHTPWQLHSCSPPYGTRAVCCYSWVAQKAQGKGKRKIKRISRQIREPLTCPMHTKKFESSILHLCSCMNATENVRGINFRFTKESTTPNNDPSMSPCFSYYVSPFFFILSPGFFSFPPKI